MYCWLGCLTHSFSLFLILANVLFIISLVGWLADTWLGALSTSGLVAFH